jgi:hypothetical protein
LSSSFLQEFPGFSDSPSGEIESVVTIIHPYYVPSAWNSYKLHRILGFDALSRNPIAEMEQYSLHIW